MYKDRVISPESVQAFIEDIEKNHPDEVPAKKYNPSFVSATSKLYKLMTREEFCRISDRLAKINTDLREHWTEQDIINELKRVG